ncbi:MAG: hypothetical protein KDD60_08390 [Bdellovibrionales bacterium]|nr:hypothetical protein [Bdellovibrionales bacterium]
MKYSNLVMRALFLILSLGLLIGCGGSTTGTGGVSVEGKVLVADAQGTVTPVSNAQVFVTETGDSAVSDANGNYVIVTDKRAAYTLLVEVEEFSATTTITDVPANVSKVKANLRLDRESNTVSGENVEFEREDSAESTDDNSSAGDSSGSDDSSSNGSEDSSSSGSSDRPSNDDSSSNSGSSGNNGSGSNDDRDDDDGTDDHSGSGDDNSGSHNDDSSSDDDDGSDSGNSHDDSSDNSDDDSDDDSNSGSGNGDDDSGDDSDDSDDDSGDDSDGGDSGGDMCDERDAQGSIVAVNSSSISVSGVTFTITSQTRIRDEDGNSISASDLEVGQKVKVQGDCQGSTLVAKDIRIDD